MKESVNVLRSDQNTSEFAMIESLSLDLLTSYGMESTPYGYEIQNHEQIAAILEDLSSKIGMMQTSHYFRAGKTYFTINHVMGKAGNLFFKSLFENLLRHYKEKPHVVSEQNGICVIFRI